MTKRIKFGLKMAKIGFCRSAYKKKRVGAALIQGNRILIGSNSTKTSPISKKLGSFWEREHAEMSILKSLNDMGGHLFVFRAKHSGELGLSRPCPSCMKLILEKGIRTITYTTENGIATERLI